jgi:hypothetical protein
MARSGCYHCPPNMVKQCELDFGLNGCPPCANAAVENVNSAQHTQPAICAHLKINRLCYLWGHRSKKVCACCEAARKQQASA